MRQHWIGEDIDAGAFRLRSYRPAQIASAKTLTIYIEGDGLAWIGRDMPSGDPTPSNPVGLKLALAQPEGNAVYLARPCQYTGTENCSPRFWKGARFAREVVAATNIAVNRLKAQFLAQEIHLVGYSGGAAIAVLLAATRNDVRRLTTLAGNLDHASWTRMHRVSPLDESLNPADEAYRVREVAQHHWVGERDLIIPPQVALSFVQRGGIDPSTVNVVKNIDHQCCWEERWPDLWAATSD